MHVQRSLNDWFIKYTSAGKYTICFFQLSHFFTRCTTHTAYTALVGCLAIAYKSHAFETCYCTAFHIPMDTTVWENWMECLCMCECVVCECCTIFMNMEIFQRMPFTQWTWSDCQKAKQQTFHRICVELLSSLRFYLGLIVVGQKLYRLQSGHISMIYGFSCFSWIQLFGIDKELYEQRKWRMHSIQEVIHCESSGRCLLLCIFFFFRFFFLNSFIRNIS